MKFKDICNLIEDSCDTELIAVYDGEEYPIVDYSYVYDHRFCMNKDGRYYSLNIDELDVFVIDVQDNKLNILLDVSENVVTDAYDNDLGFIPEE